MNNMHKMILAGGLLACASVVSAEESPFTGNVALTTDYTFRGISQTAEDPAVQGGFDFNHKSGAYAGVWGSNLNFGEPISNDAHLETDLYAGYRWEMAKLKWDVGAIHYMYPGAVSEAEYDFTEVYVGAGYGPVSVKASYTDDLGTDLVGTDDESAYYVEANASFDLPMEVALGLHVGMSDGDYFDASGDYLDYKVSVSKEVAGFGVSLAYVDTDLPEIESGAFANDERFVLTLSRSL